MPSNRTPTTFYGPDTPSSAGEVLYTVPANKIAVIRFIEASPANDSVEIGVGGTSANQLVYERTWTGGADSVTDWYYLPLTEGQTLDGITGDDEVTITVTGDLYDE